VSFAHEAPGLLGATSGAWTFHAVARAWSQVGTQLDADELGFVQLHFSGPSADVQRHVREWAPSYGWTFMDYRVETDAWARC
jgi:hypothetical protein